MDEAHRENKGCFSIKNTAVSSGLYLDGSIKIEYFRCPGNFKDGETSAIFTLFGLYEKGFSPFEGAVFDWPNKIVETFSLIVQLKNEKQEQDLRRQEAAQRRPGNGKRKRT